MSYQLKISKDKPKGLWLLNGNLTDSSGNAEDATQVGSAITEYSSALVANCLFSSKVDDSHKVKFPMRLYKPGYENDAFTLEAWVFPQGNETTILSRTGHSDGLAFVNGELTFSVRLNSSTPTISYKPDVNKTMHVVGVYTKKHITLYINGSLTERLDFTVEQQLDDFIAPSEDYMIAGEHGAVLLQAVAIYEYALSINQIRLHYKYGRDAVDPASVPRIYGGKPINISRDHGSIFLQEMIGPNLSWTLGDMDTLAVNKNGELVQQWDGTVFKKGTWRYAFDTSFEPEIYGVTLGWEGTGDFDVSTSLDGQVWESAENNNLVSGIIPDSSPLRLYTKIDFPERDLLTTYEWLGTPGESESVKKIDGEIVSRNIQPDPFFSYSGGGYVEATWTNGSAVLDDSIYATRNQSLRIDTVIDGSNGGFNGNLLTSVTGSEVTATVRVKFDPTDPDVGVNRTLFRIGGGGVVAQSFNTKILDDDDWHEYSLTVPASGEIGQLRLYLYGSQFAGHSRWFDAVSVSESDTALLFDGDSESLRKGTLTNLEITGFKSKEPFSPNREIEVDDGIALREPWYPLENRTDYGLICNGQTITIPASAVEDGTEDHTWEYWYYAKSADIEVTVSNASTYYQNGETYSSINIGSWNLIHIVSDGSTALSELNIGGDIILGHVAVYPTALTADQCNDIYQMYTGKLVVPVDIGTGIAIDEPEIKSYTSDWAVVGSG